MRGNKVYTLLIILFIGLSIVSQWASAEEDPCKETGIIVKNLTIRTLWYKKADGVCFIWQRNHIFTIYPDDTIDIYSDLTCETLHCGLKHTYDDYKTLDVNNNCMVKILPRCNFSDM